MGEYFDIRPGPHSLACRDLAPELRAHRLWIYGAPASGGHRFVSLAEPALGGPMHARLVRTTTLRYDATVQKRPGSTTTARLAPYRRARTTGEFFAPHSGPARIAHFELAFDIRCGLCHVPGDAPPQGRRLCSVSAAPTPRGSTFTQDEN